jgi:hypothetical protein
MASSKVGFARPDDKDAAGQLMRFIFTKKTM